ncbi:TonB C-terminal domain-containing protein [Helicobacter cynogastricus]|uniref:TonB C-terminal domain-containing protein n=1 Tax=Helicobacter cynogastricus TaxID=329937 RepID=UPI000CF0F284|nr:TonB C-terminal domain-containing protein [Helicobacter cynogastricus]
MENKALGIGAGALACACYAVLLGLLLSKQNYDIAVMPEESIDVDFIANSPPMPKSIPTSPAPIPFKDPGISDIFSSVAEPSKPQKSTNVQQRRDMQEVQNLLKTMEFSQHQQAFKDIQSSLSAMKEKLQTLQHKNIDLQVPKEEKKATQEYQAWFQNLYAILYGHWKLGFKQPASVRALITISATGQFSYALINYSPFPQYNQEIENLLSALQGQKFTPYPKGSITLAVNFTTRDQ